MVADYLRERHDALRERFQRAVARHHEPRARVLAPFDVQAEFAADSIYRGCAFARAVAESHAAGMETAASDYRRWIRETFAGLAAEAGATDPSMLAMQLHALWDGAPQSLQMDHDPKVVRAARDAHCIDGQATAANQRIAETLGTPDAEEDPGDEDDGDMEQAS